MWDTRIDGTGLPVAASAVGAVVGLTSAALAVTEGAGGAGGVIGVTVASGTRAGEGPTRVNA